MKQVIACVVMAWVGFAIPLDWWPLGHSVALASYLGGVLAGRDSERLKQERMARAR